MIRGKEIWFILQPKSFRVHHGKHLRSFTLSSLITLQTNFFGSRQYITQKKQKALTNLLY